MDIGVNIGSAHSVIHLKEIEPTNKAKSTLIAKMKTKSIYQSGTMTALNESYMCYLANVKSASCIRVISRNDETKLLLSFHKEISDFALSKSNKHLLCSVGENSTFVLWNLSKPLLLFFFFTFFFFPSYLFLKIDSHFSLFLNLLTFF